MKKLYKSKTEVMIKGVCGGISTYFGLNPIVVRILFIVFALTGNIIIALIAYIIMSAILPIETDIIDIED